MQIQISLKNLLVLCCCLLLVGTSFAPVYSGQERANLAGTAVFPNQHHKEWLQVQNNPDFAAKDKIIHTVNTYFTLKFESWLKGTLLDFGFLFNTNDVNAWNDYAYERGIYFVNLTGWKCLKTLLLSYDYHPEFYKVEIEGDKAIVEMKPNAQIVTQDIPDRTDPGPWAKHTFELVLSGKSWLIQKIMCNDPIYYAYPRNIDFDREAEELIKSYKKERSRIDVLMTALMRGGLF